MTAHSRTLKEARLKAGWSQEELSRRSLVSAKTIGKIEQSVSNGSRLTWARLEKALWAEGVEL